ncbi:MAG: D-2-hydroxyacid dehydrogenase [Desulfofustis sp.]|nr:D-2-hydroxyacid dehydrogenase [Desulfofustis sp.]
MNKLLIYDDDASIYLAEIEKRNLPEIEIHTAISPEEAQLQAPTTDIIFGRPVLVASILPEARQLRWVQSTFAGVEPLCESHLPDNYVLTGVKELFGSLMSEYVFGYILARERSILATARNQQKKIWKRIKYRSLSGVTIGIVGLGSIGREIARTASHFSMRTLGLKRTPGDIDNVEHIYQPADLNQFLPQLDYLVLVLPDTTETRCFISKNELALMKDSSVLINVGRGVTIDQGDLLAALQARIIGGAILDVFEDEPLPPDNPLWNMENVVITPHNSAFSFPDQVAAIFCENYLRYVNGLPLRHVVNFSKGY